MQASTRSRDLQASTRYTGLWEFTRRAYLQASTGCTCLLELIGRTGLLELRRRAILEFTDLLKQKVQTISLELTGIVGLQHQQDTQAYNDWQDTNVY